MKKIISGKTILLNTVTNTTFIADDFDEEVQTGSRQSDTHVEWAGELDIAIPMNCKENFDKYIEDHIFDRLNNAFSGDYKIERGIGDRVMVDDKVIKGILFTPPRKDYKSVNEHADMIIELIGEDIKRGRFIELKQD